jgi:predicted  nucleic acid-binding Zn-ribbon protein
VKEYKEDVKEFETLAATKQLKHLKETRSAKALSKRIDKLVTDLDQIVNTLDKKQDSLKKDIEVRSSRLFKGHRRENQFSLDQRS